MMSIYRHIGVDAMLKGLPKMSMLRIISENKATGIEIMKKVNSDAHVTAKTRMGSALWKKLL